MQKPISKPATPGKISNAPTPSGPVIIRSIFPDPIFTGDRQPSIIHPEFSGLNLVTGFRGKGKTSWGLKIDNPLNICMIDAEDKGRTLAQQRKFTVGAYFQPVTDAIDLMGERYDLQGVYDRIVQIVNAIPKGRFTSLFIDNAQCLQDGAQRFLANNLSQGPRYGVRPDNIVTGGFGGALPGAKHMIAELIHLANSKEIKVITVSFQLKGAWAKGQPLFNKFKTTDVDIWHQLSVCTLAMVDPLPQHFPIPRALVMKESLSLMEWDEDKQFTRQIRRVPPALPQAEPRFLYNYLNNPADMAKLKEGESVTALELAPFAPTFSDEQVMLFERMARAQKELGINEEEE